MNEHNTSENDNILIGKTIYYLDTELKKENRFKHDFETFKRRLVKTELDESSFRSSNENNNINRLNLNLDEEKKEDFKQFDLNSERYNVKSSYNENIYTTEIDYKQISDDLVQRAQSLENVIGL